MKPFNLELAKAGHPVCTRDGRDARILCFDRKGVSFPIIALVSNDSGEQIYSYDINGTDFGDNISRASDLFMKSTKKEGWINIYKGVAYTMLSEKVYETKEKAFENKCTDRYVDTIKIEWKE